MKEFTVTVKGEPFTVRIVETYQDCQQIERDEVYVTDLQGFGNAYRGMEQYGRYEVSVAGVGVLGRFYELANAALFAAHKEAK